MGKQQQQNRLAQNKKGELLVEQNVAIDDNLLPNAIELEKLKEVDPKIIDWILVRTEVEQSARIEFNQNRMKLANRDLTCIHIFNFMGLSFGLIIFLVVLALSAYFLYKGLDVQGTIFGGTAIIGGVIVFVRAASVKRKDQ